MKNGYTGPLTEKINKAVVIGRRNEAGKDAYREEIINYMLRLGKEPEEIALLCDNPEEYVKEVKTKLTEGQNTDGTC